MKRAVRRLERIASSCQTPESASAWMKERRIYRSLLRNKCESFWMRKINDEKSSPRQLWRSIDVLLGRGGVPSCDNIEAQQFHDYFDAKVAGVRSSTDGASPPSFTTSSSNVHFTCFEPITIDEVVAAVRVLPDKSCALDPLPTPTLKSVIDVLAPFLTELFNRSLTTGRVPAVFITAYISPRLKKVDPDSLDVQSYRPISNLSILSKLLERLVARQLLDHLSSSGLLPRFQSAYRAHHSTETAVPKVLTDILLAVDAGDLYAIVLLDLSAAFDTVDHGILLHRLDSSYQIVGSVQQWFQSYLSNRLQHVRVGSSSSSPGSMVFGVPQGSVLGVILFFLYSSDLQLIIESHGLCPHLYADDS